MSSYEETFWCVEPGRDAPVPRADKKHDELKSFGRFWYQEIRDFLNSKRTVQGAVPTNDRFGPRFRSQQLDIGMSWDFLRGRNAP